MRASNKAKPSADRLANGGAVAIENDQNGVRKRLVKHIEGIMMRCSFFSARDIKKGRQDGSDVYHAHPASGTDKRLLSRKRRYEPVQME